MAADTSLFLEPRGDVLFLKLNDPSGFPRLSRSVLQQVAAAMDRLNQESKWRGGVISGAEKCFAVGADLEEIELLNGVTGREFAELGQRVMLGIEKSRKPIVAAVRGYCFGGGMDLALACRVRIASTDATFGHRGAALGIITGWGGTQRLPRVLGPNGRALALELMTTARSLGAEEALACGLVSAVHDAPKLLPAAIALARADSVRAAPFPIQANGR